MKHFILITSIALSSSTHPMGLFSSTKPLARTDQNVNKELTATQPIQAQPSTNVTVPAGQTINITTNVSHADNSISSTHNAMNQMQHVQQITMQEVYQSTIATLKNVIDAGALKSRELGEWLRANKFKIGFGGACICYAALVAYLMRAHYRLQDEALWARWRIEDSYEQLATMDAKKLGNDLVFAIQRRYTTSAQFTDFIQPLVKFMQDLETEKRFLKNYLMAAKWIDRAYMHRILPINENKVALAKKLLQRLQFIEHIFLSWAAEFKIQQAVP